MGTTPRVKCALHSVHVPEPTTLEKHEEFFCDTLTTSVGEQILVCPTGHANIHTYLARLMRGEYPRGRRGLTGRLALRAFYWYKDNKGG